jgi:hypothetical protein
MTFWTDHNDGSPGIAVSKDEVTISLGVAMVPLVLKRFGQRLACFNDRHGVADDDSEHIVSV